jgi:hypothetical protein
MCRLQSEYSIMGSKVYRSFCTRHTEKAKDKAAQRESNKAKAKCQLNLEIALYKNKF